MHAPPTPLARLLHPVPLEVFLQEYWERRPLLLPHHAPDYFSSLFSQEELEALLWSANLGWGEVQLANHRRGQGWVDATRHPPSLDRLARAHAQGDTVILNDVQLRSRPVARLCRDLEALFNHVVNVNMYLTPRGAQGLAPHFDTQDVFILQIRGSKHWKLSAPCVPLPHEGLGRELTPDDPREPLLTAHLRAGDVLYMPRGVIHEALTADDESLHLTVGVNVLTWSLLLEEVLRAASDQDVESRRALPPGFLSREELLPRLREGLEALLGRLSASLPVEEGVERLARRYLSRLHPLPDEDLRHAQDAGTVDLETRVRRRAGMFCRVHAGDGTVRIDFPGGSVEGPAPLEPALRFVAREEEFAVGELPGGLSEKTRLILARRLLSEGLLREARAPSRSDSAGTPRPGE